MRLTIFFIGPQKAGGLGFGVFIIKNLIGEIRILLRPMRNPLGIIEMKFVALIVSLISLSESGVFCWMGAIYLDTADGEWIVLVTGCLLLLYGVISGLALIIAWMRSIRFLRPLSIWAAAIVLTLWIAGSMDYGMISGHELLGIILLGCMLLFNVLGVCLALKLHDRAQQGSAPDAG